MTAIKDTPSNELERAIGFTPRNGKRKRDGLGERREDHPTRDSMTDEPKCKTCGDTGSVDEKITSSLGGTWPCPDCNPEAIRWAGTEAPVETCPVCEAPLGECGLGIESCDWQKKEAKLRKAPSGAEGGEAFGTGRTPTPDEVERSKEARPFAVSGASPSALDDAFHAWFESQDIVPEDSGHDFVLAEKLFPSIYAAGQATQGVWQPIETAPKDGTIIDLWAKDLSATYRIADCSWDSPGTTGPNVRDKCWVQHLDDGWKEAVESPTHWMPLPDPPNGESQ